MEDRFLRGRQMAYMIYEYFWVTGAHEAVLDYTELFSITLDGDDIQDFDVSWDQVCDPEVLAEFAETRCLRGKVACECRRSRGTTRPRTAAASTRVCLMPPPQVYASFQIKMSNATGSHVPAQSRTAAALKVCSPLRVGVLNDSCSADS